MQILHTQVEANPPGITSLPLSFVMTPFSRHCEERSDETIYPKIVPSLTRFAMTRESLNPRYSYLYRIHLTISGRVGRFPYIKMPTR